MSTLLRIMFAGVCLAQLAAPVSMIVKHEQTVSGGTLWRFQTAPVDPNDPFRGRYVRLSYAVERDPLPFEGGKGPYAMYDERMYAELATGADGFARLTRLHAERPQGVEYIDVFMQRARPRTKDDPPNAPLAYFVRMPFDRYYLPESRAPEIEREYRDASRAGQTDTYAEVRVRDGHAALVNFVLKGKPVAGR